MAANLQHRSGAFRLARAAAIVSLLTLAGAAWGAGLPRSDPETQGMSSARLKRLDSVVEEAVARGETPGAVLLVARHGKTVYEKAFGRRALEPAEEPMTADTVFDMASLTKVMATATSVMILVEEGKISLDDPVARHLPEFGENGKDAVTVLQLLTHYSGLRADIDLDEPWSGYETGIQLGFAEKLNAVPGRRFVYSDINYFILGELVRKVSGLPLDQFAAERIFEPLGMRDTGFNPSPQLRPRIAPTQWEEGEMLRGRVHDPTARRMGGAAGHAGLFSTAEDTALFAQAILNGGSWNGVLLLSPLAVAQMTSNQAPDGQSDWRGLGFDIRSRFSSNRGDLFPVDSFGHTGFTGTSLWIDPSTATVVILLCNRLHPNGGGDVVSLRKKAATVAAAAIVDAPWRGPDGGNR